MSYKKRSNPKFRKGQYIVITETTRIDTHLGLKVGYVYLQIDLQPYLHCRTAIRGDIQKCEGYKRLNQNNWRFAKTEEVKMFINNNGPVAVILKNVDNYSII